MAAMVYNDRLEQSTQVTGTLRFSCGGSGTHSLDRIAVNVGPRQWPEIIAKRSWRGRKSLAISIPTAALVCRSWPCGLQLHRGSDRVDCFARNHCTHCSVYVSIGKLTT